jgi:hypothetical protein
MRWTIPNHAGFAGSWRGKVEPTTVGGDQPNNRYIAANTRRSFRVFRDDDHDGHCDHEHQGQN